MSYWVYLRSPEGETLSVEHHVGGGTHVMGGTDEAELNVTYNYGEVFSLFGFSIRDLHQKRASETIETLRQLAGKLPDKPYQADYWAPTPGNAGRVIHTFLTWATQHPNAVWEVS